MFTMFKMFAGSTSTYVHNVDNACRFYKYQVWQDFTEPVNLGKLAENSSVTALEVHTICQPGDQLTRAAVSYTHLTLPTTPYV